MDSEAFDSALRAGLAGAALLLTLDNDTSCNLLETFLSTDASNVKHVRKLEHADMKFKSGSPKPKGPITTTIMELLDGFPS